MYKPLAITPGEPAGIGPDIVLQYWQHNKALEAPLVAFADRDLMIQRAQKLQIPLNYLDYDVWQTNPEQTDKLIIHHIPLASTCTLGELNPKNAEYVLACLRAATQFCLQGDCAALVTGPVHKGNINVAGIPFTGHTEFLAQLCNVEHTVMMLMTEQLKVALVTTHLPLAAVAQAITAEHLTRCINILNQDLLTRFSITMPRITVCGLNPHAGENGHMGTEEQTTIIPVLNALRARGLTLIGPIPADTAFIPSQLQQCDVVLAMYHDQGLPVLKQQGFGEAINVTLGLPIVRTSVDHGTALDLAGTGRADWSSLAAAIKWAHKLCHK